MALIPRPSDSNTAVRGWVNAGGPTSGAASERLGFPQSRIIGGITDWEALGGYNGEDILIQGATPIKRDIEVAANQVGAQLQEIEVDFDDINGHPEYAVHIYSTQADLNIDIMAFLPDQFSTSMTANYNGILDVISGLPVVGTIVDGIRKVGNVATLMGVAPVIQPLTAQVWQGSDHINLTLPLIFLLDEDSEKDILNPLRQLLSLTMPRLLTSTQSSSSYSGEGLLMKSPGPKYVVKRGIIDDLKKDRATGADQRAGEGVMEAADRFFRDAVSSVLENVNSVKDVWNGASSEKILETLSGSFGGLGFNNAEIKDNLVVRCGEFFIIPSAIVTSVDQDWQILLDRHSKRPIALSLTVGFQSWVVPKADDLDVIIPKA